MSKKKFVSTLLVLALIMLALGLVIGNASGRTIEAPDVPLQFSIPEGKAAVISCDIGKEDEWGKPDVRIAPDGRVQIICHSPSTKADVPVIAPID